MHFSKMLILFFFRTYIDFYKESNEFLFESLNFIKCRKSFHRYSNMDYCMAYSVCALSGKCKLIAILCVCIFLFPFCFLTTVFTCVASMESFGVANESTNLHTEKIIRATIQTHLHCFKFVLCFTIWRETEKRTVSTNLVNAMYIQYAFVYVFVRKEDHCCFHIVFEEPIFKVIQFMRYYGELSLLHHYLERLLVHRVNI